MTRRPAYLFRAERGWPGATPGTPVLALVPGAGPAGAGALVPDAAVVQWEGLAWTYRRLAADAFERVRVPTVRPAPDGWIAGRRSRRATPWSYAALRSCSPRSSAPA